MKEKNKHWKKLILNLLAILLIFAGHYFVKVLEKTEFSFFGFEYRIIAKLLLAIMLIPLYNVIKNGYFLYWYYFANPDRLKPMIPGGFKGFYHLSQTEIMKKIRSAYDFYDDDTSIISLKKVALWRQFGPKRLKVDMLNGDNKCRIIRLKHVTLVIEIEYFNPQESIPERQGLQTDYYYFSTGNIFVTHKRESLILPEGWTIKEDILGLKVNEENQNDDN